MDGRDTDTGQGEPADAPPEAASLWTLLLVDTNTLVPNGHGAPNTAPSPSALLQIAGLVPFAVENAYTVPASLPT